MSMIKPKTEQKNDTIRIKINSDVLNEINQYCAYAGFKKIDAFFEEAASYILSRDKDFKGLKDTIA